MAGGRGGGILHEMLIHPIKSLLTLIFVSTIVLTLILPPKDAIATVGAVSVTLYRAGGVVVGSIPPGVAAFKQGFVAMSNYSPSNSGWSTAANKPAPPQAVAPSKPKPSASPSGH